MIPTLILLPILTFLVLFLDFSVLAPAGGTATDWRKAYLQAALACGVWTALTSEVLSLANALTTAGVALVWTAALLAGLIFGLRDARISRGWQTLLLDLKTVSAAEVVAGVGFAAILGLLFATALISPSNNSDSLLYHMSRVVHWAQNQSLRHYPTAFEPQLYNPIWAEEAILHARLLWGGDGLANLVQWGSLLGGLVGVSALAGLLGASRKGQWIAAAFALSIPMGILQASSTQNDLVTAFWLVCLAYFVTLSAQRDPSRVEFVCLSAALGLGMLTKGTFYPYAVPFGVWFLLARLVHEKPRQILAQIAAVVLIAGLLNAGYWLRNVQTYGTPLGPSSWVENRTANGLGIGTLAKGLIRDSALNFATPSERVNQQISGWIEGLLEAIGQKADFSLVWGWNHEDLAGSPIHFALIVICAVGLLFLRSKNRLQVGYTLSAIGCFVMLALVVTFDPYGARYQLPYLMVSGPLCGYVLERLFGRKIAWVLIAGFLAISLPWVAFNRTRPLIALRENPERFGIHCQRGLGCTSIGSILNEPGSTIIFANWISLRDPYQAVVKDLLATGCQDVGLRIDSHDKEYIFWWLLQAPQSGIRVESIYYDANLARYADPTFKPCAVICTICGERTQVNGLDLSAAYDAVRLYTGDNYQGTE